MTLNTMTLTVRQQARHVTAGLEADLHVTPSHKHDDMKLSLRDHIRTQGTWTKCTEHEEPTASRGVII